MARFEDIPLKSPLAGNEVLAAGDPDSGDDVGITPDELVAYNISNLPLVTSTGNGFMRSADYDRLYDTYTKEQQDVFNAIFKEELIGFYIGTVADGYIEFYSHLGSDQSLVSATVKTASGTVTAAVKINGVVAGGLTGMAASSVASNYLAGGSPPVNLQEGDTLGLQFSANSTALGFYVTILSYAQIPSY